MGQLQRLTSVGQIASRSIGGAPSLVLAGFAISFAVMVGANGPSPVALALVLLGALLLARVLATMDQSATTVAAGSDVMWWGRRVLVLNGVFSLVVVTFTILSGTGSWLVVGLFALLLLIVLGLGWDVLRETPQLFGGRSKVLFLASVGIVGLLWVLIVPTGIDVVMFQEVASQRLLDGVNPYAPGYPDIYPPELSRRFYAPGLSIDGVLQVGFPYPPASLLFVFPGRVLGDVRFAHLGAMLAAGALMIRLVPSSPLSRLGGVLLLTSPMVFFVVRHGWTEPFLLLALTGLLFAMARDGRWQGPLLGASIALKQFAVIFLPVIVVIGGLRDRRRRFANLAWAAGVAAMITLPFLLWDVGDFVRSIVELHLQQPFREDSLSLLAVGVRVLDWPPASMHTILMGLALLGTSAFVLRKAPRTTWAVAAGSAFVMLGFVILSKQAFANYYFLIAGLIFLSLSSWDAGSAPQDEDDMRSRSELRSARVS